MSIQNNTRSVQDWRALSHTSGRGDEKRVRKVRGGTREVTLKPTLPSHRDVERGSHRTLKSVKGPCAALSDLAAGKLEMEDKQSRPATTRH